MSSSASKVHRPPFQIAVVPVTAFQQNASVIVDGATSRAAIVDPGGDLDRLQDVLGQMGGEIESIILTHGHLDHAGGATELKERLEAETGRTIPIIGPHRDDAFLLNELPRLNGQYGFTRLRAVTPDRWLEEGDEVRVGETTFSIMHCPGHSPGSVVFYQEAAKFLLAGDVLFAGSIGRTDFPYGSHEQLIDSIVAKLLPLPDDVTFLPGHGPSSTIGRERATNPYLPR